MQEKYSLILIRRVVRVVEGAAPEMLCGVIHLGFESLTLRHQPVSHVTYRLLFYCVSISSQAFLIAETSGNDNPSAIAFAEEILDE